MHIFLHMFLIGLLVQMSLRRDKPALWAGIYSGVWLLFRLPPVLSDMGATATVLAGFAAILAASALFFWLLSRLGDGLGWWITVLAGNILVFIAGEVGLALLPALNAE